MITIDGPLWFVCALLICGWYVLYLRRCSRERRQHLAWWQQYDAGAVQRHAAFIGALRGAGEWGWDRDRCIREIAAAGLPVPPKSACLPSTKPSELIQLAKKHPDLVRRAIALEDRARPHLTKIEGLWGNGCKGTRGAEKRPGSWRAFLAEHAPEVLPELPSIEEVA